MVGVDGKGMSGFQATVTKARPVFGLGVLGLTLSALCAMLALIRGNLVIGAEGDLTKAITFDGAVGVYFLTIGFFIPLAQMSARGLRRWLGWSVGLAIYAYGAETIQILRGLDPRFTKVGGPVDQILGGVFFLIALGFVAMFSIVAIKLVRRDTHGPDGLLLLGIRYAIGATLLAFAAGVWMSLAGGRTFGAAGNILPLHAIGFHGLQAVPLVAWLLSRSKLPDHDARRWIHLTGVSWLAACLAIAWQTGAGVPVTEFSIALALAIVFVLAWSVGALLAARAWLNAKTAGATGY
jgi:hypothetical protein